MKKIFLIVMFVIAAGLNAYADVMVQGGNVEVSTGNKYMVGNASKTLSCPGKILKDAVVTGGIVTDGTCADDVTGIISESDPQVGNITTSGKWCTSNGSSIDCAQTAPLGSLTNGKWCTTDGTKVNCATNAPLTSEVDPKVGTLTNAKWCTTDGAKVNCTLDAPTLNELDPQVNTLTNGKWCTTDGTTVNCTSDAPTLNESDPQVGNITTSGKWCTSNGLSIDCAQTAPLGTLTNGQWCTTDGSKVNCTSSAPLTSEADGIIGNEVTDAAVDGTLIRSGSGTAASPYKLSLDLTHANIWTGVQTYNAGATFPASGIWNTAGNVGIGTSTPSQKLEVNGTAKVNGLMLASGAAKNKVLTSDASGNASWSVPVVVKSFKGTSNNSAVYYDTNLLSSDYFCTVGGMYIGVGDINENSGSGNPTFHSSCYVNGSNHWLCGGYMNQNGSTAPEVRVTAVCWASGMVDSSGYQQIYP